MTINVSAEHIDKTFQGLLTQVRIPGFLLLEHGTNGNIEKELRKKETDPIVLFVWISE